MKIPHAINSNIFKQYEPSKVSTELVPESKRRIKSEDKNWDDSHPPKLTELCLMAIVANFENRIILNELPCWDRDFLLEILPTDLPLPLVAKHIHDDFYWERKVKDRWKDCANYCQNYGFNWKRMYMEKHAQEAVETMTPEGFDLENVEELCELCKDYVKNLNLRQLQILQSNVTLGGDEVEDDVDEEEQEDQFTVLPDPCDHIDLGPIIRGLVNLTELHVCFGLRNVGSDYKKSWFQFSVQDCRNLGAGVAKARNLRLLRIHSCNLDDDKLIALLFNMKDNKSLEELEFSNCIIGDDGATGIARFLKNRSNLKKLNLCNNRIREEGMSALAFMLTQSYASPLEYLNLKFNTFGDPGLKLLASALVRGKTQIKTLNISCCNLAEESGVLLGEMLHRDSVITDLDLSNNHLGEVAGRAIAAALDINKTVQYLDLRMTEISMDDLVKINQALHFNRIRALKGDKGVEREKKLMEKREEAEKERLRLEEIEAARKAEEEEVAARKAAAQSNPNPDE